MSRFAIASLLLCLTATPASAGVLYAKTSTALGTSIVVVDPVTGVTGPTLASGLGPITCATVFHIGGNSLFFFSGGMLNTLDLQFGDGLKSVPLSLPIVPENVEQDTSSGLLIARVST